MGTTNKDVISIAQFKKTVPDAEIVFIDPRVNGWEQLITGVKPGIEVIIINPKGDGVEQITKVLQWRQGVIAAHIIAQGSPACMYLGSSRLSLDTLDYYAWQMHEWFAKLPPGSTGNILLYACRVAAGNIGAEFLDKLHHLTGANIAASAKLIGSSAMGGTWKLTECIGVPKFGCPFTKQARENYLDVF